ncbi:MAG: DUF2066 domain-containing protein [Pseudomonadota bacterium]|nr:DUF2066 domain-containing protein [Pseudomonadota bacterium]
MRSFNLLFVIMSLLVVQQVQSADSAVMPESFFTVTLPYDAVIQTSQKGNESINNDLLSTQTQKGMQILLMRLTGRKQLVASKVGQEYINNSKNWLASYYIKPRVEDGVAVGKNIELQFDSNRLKKAFSDQHIKLWAVTQRPKTLVMGTFVQQGRLEKLNQEILDYRVDVDYRDMPKQLGLPVTIPEERAQWVFPVEPNPSDSKVQEILVSTNQQNLLSFKLVALANGKYELSWYLFALNGSTLAQNESVGFDRQVLMQAMFEGLMQQYVKFSAVQNIRKNQLYLNIHQVAFGDQINQLEEELKQQQPMIRKVNLVSLQAGKAQFDIEYQGDYQNVLNWLKQWSKVQFVDALSNQQEIDVNVRYQFFKPQLKYKAQPVNQSGN